MTSDATSLPVTLAERRKQILYRAQRRGFREADLWIGTFALDHVPAFGADELDAFEHVISAEDQDLYAWLMDRTPVPDEFNTPMYAALKAFRPRATLDQEDNSVL